MNNGRGWRSRERKRLSRRIVIRMQATDFEFRYRFFIIGACYWVPFWLYQVDKQNAGATIGKWVARQVDIPNDTAIRMVFVLGALVCVLAASIRTWASSYLQS